jgi:hypothetical protein
MARVTFRLRNVSNIEAVAARGAMKLSVRGGEQLLWVENAPGDGLSKPDRAYKAAVNAGRRAANTFLDQLAFHTGEANQIDETYVDAEWIDEGGVCRGAQTRSPQKVEVVDHLGRPIQALDTTRNIGEVRLSGSQAASYFRRAKLATDPFDKFRNFYLAAENIADKIRVAKTISKGSLKKAGDGYEGGLLLLALEECFAPKSEDLQRLAEAVAGFDRSAPLLSEAARLLYKGFRCQLNHSKASEQKRVPFDSTDEGEVRQVLPLIELVARSLLQREQEALP